jgi:hypothetical protein
VHSEGREHNRHSLWRQGKREGQHECGVSVSMTPSWRKLEAFVQLKVHTMMSDLPNSAAQHFEFKFVSHVTAAAATTAPGSLRNCPVLTATQSL